jgi:cytochrome c-type biogenesis protein CcmF
LFAKAADDLTAQQSEEFLALALRGLTQNYTQNPPPARFRFEVNPMVTWIWLGGLIVLLGGLLAGWPTPRGPTRVASARYAARVGREVRERVPV